MVGSAVTKDFGVMASDGAMYDTEKGEMSFENPKLMVFGQKALSFIGTHLYLANLDRARMSMPFDALCLFMKDYLKEQKPKVEDQMKAIPDADEAKPHFCLFLMGMHRGFPTVAQFNSFADFEPKYLWSDNGLKFSTILFGDDSQPEKAAIFKDSTQYMEMKAKQYEAVSPGIVAEILTRGIYRKADEEMKIGLKKKYAGGAVSVVSLSKAGISALSGFHGG